MDRKTKGRLAEAKVIAHLLSLGYEIYLPFSGNSKYDILAYEGGMIKRISVKYASTRGNSGAWTVEMRQIFRGNKKVMIHKFDKNEYDIVAVYIGPEDKTVLIDARSVKPRSLSIKLADKFGEVA